MAVLCQWSLLLAPDTSPALPPPAASDSARTLWALVFSGSAHRAWVVVLFKVSLSAELLELLA